MTRGQLLFAIAKWAVENHTEIDLDDWDAISCDAKQKLRDILDKANCENIYVGADKVMPSAHTTIKIPHNLRLSRTKWEGNKLVFEYEEKYNGFDE